MGTPKVDRVGAREEDYAKLYQWLDENFPGRYSPYGMHA